MTELGRGGLASDRERAVKLYEQAASGGVEEAREALKRLGATAN
jgi:TPR repeat protein